jgi:hypothetical protein
MREFNVEEGNPSLAAAPLDPDTKHDDRGNRCEIDLTFIDVFKLSLLLENALYGLLADRTNSTSFS